MQAWMWRLTDDYAVIYTDDRATLKALFAYSRFPHQDLSRATTYERKNGRVFAWQFTFPVSAWNGVVRHLGRASITMLDQERWTTVAEAAPQISSPVQPPKNGKKSRSAAPVPAAAKEQAVAPKRARKPECRPAADLTQPLQPMSGAGSKTKTARADSQPAVPTANPLPQVTQPGTTGSPAKKRATASAVATETVPSSKRQGTRSGKGGIVTEREPIASSPPAKSRAALAVPETAETRPSSKTKPDAKSKAYSTAKPETRRAPAAAAVVPVPAGARPAAGKKHAMDAPPERRDAGNGKRRAPDEERLLAELAEVQLRLEALSEAIPPPASKGPAQLKTTQQAAPAGHGVKGNPAEALRSPVSPDAKRKAAVSPKPNRVMTAPLGTATGGVAVLDAPLSPPRKSRAKAG